MTAEQILALAMSSRAAQGLKVTAYGIDGYTVEQPYTVFAPDQSSADRAVAKLKAQGFTVVGGAA